MFDCCKEVYEDDLIDLRQRYGSSYEIAVEDPFFKGTECPWHYIVVGDCGTISPSGGDQLWVAYGPDGSDKDHSFHVSEFRRYAKRIKARRLNK